MSLMALLEKKLEANHGHNPNAHKGKSFQETGIKAQNCYRCQLLRRIGKMKAAERKAQGK